MSPTSRYVKPTYSVWTCELCNTDSIGQLDNWTLSRLKNQFVPLLFNSLDMLYKCPASHLYYINKNYFCSYQLNI